MNRESMAVRRPHALLSLTMLVATLVLGGCAATPEPSQGAPIHFLVFGDSGYHYDYLEAKDLARPMTDEKRREKERLKWIREKKPAADFEPSPGYRLPQTGGYVSASGLLPVADAMREDCARTRCRFAVMLGDNIYPDGATAGADGRDDAERFRKVFTEPFGDLFGANREARIYTVLGNHDWRTSREGALAQLRFHESTPPFYMEDFIYRVVPPGSNGEVEIFALDTHVLLSGVDVYDEELADDGSELPGREFEKVDPWAAPATDRERDMVAWLEESLRSSTARWKIVIAHHPLWSSAGGKFQQARKLRELLLPALCRHADLFLAGHEHTLEAHTDRCDQPGGAAAAPLPQIVSGAAAKQRGVNRAFLARQLRANPQLRTLYARGMVWGFADIALSGDTAHVRMVSVPDDGEGAPRTEFERDFTRRTRQPGR